MVIGPGQFSPYTPYIRGNSMITAVQRILKSIDQLFSDVSVSQRATLEYLEELQADIEGKIDALKADMKASHD